MEKKLKRKARPNKKESQVTQKVKESTHQIWLAGLGAFSMAQEEGSKMFDNLVKQGEAMEKRTRDAASHKVDEVKKSAAKVKGKASGNWDKLEQVFEDRVARALNRLGVPSSGDIQELSERVEHLARLVESLGGSETKPAARSAPRRRAVKSDEAA